MSRINPSCDAPAVAANARSRFESPVNENVSGMGDPVSEQRYPTFVDRLPLTRQALDFATKRHCGQRREADAAPFILHPLEVAHLLYGRDYPDDVVAAGVLHDVIEDTTAASGELERLFGSRVAALVCAVTEPPGGGPYSQRKARLRAAVAGADRDAVAVFAADKVAKARELRLSVVSRRARRQGLVDPEKLEHYWACLVLIEDRLGRHPFARQLRFELEALTLLPPESSGSQLVEPEEEDPPVLTRASAR